MGKHFHLKTVRSPTLNTIKGDVTVVDFAVPSNEVFCSNYPSIKYIQPTTITLPHRKTCDMTYCHLKENTIPACLLATMIHATEDMDQHEVGEIDASQFEKWLEL
jgi:hypothetical protein